MTPPLRCLLLTASLFVTSCASTSSVASHPLVSVLDQFEGASGDWAGRSRVCPPAPFPPISWRHRGLATASRSIPSFIMAKATTSSTLSTMAASSGLMRFRPAGRLTMRGCSRTATSSAPNRPIATKSRPRRKLSGLIIALPTPKFTRCNPSASTRSWWLRTVCRRTSTF